MTYELRQTRRFARAYKKLQSNVAAGWGARLATLWGNQLDGCTSFLAIFGLLTTIVVNATN